MSTHAWFEHFKDKLQGLTEAFEQSGTSLSLLGYALKEKQLSEEAYLSWAMAHYKLPQLQARFFTETPPSKEMFAKWATHYPWSAECLPVAEWDGALIVACLQPPQDFPHSPTCILVLAPMEQMETCWTAMKAAPVESATATPKVVLQKIASDVQEEPTMTRELMPEGMDPTMGLVKKEELSETFDFTALEAKTTVKNLTPEENDESSETNSVEKLEGMEGLEGLENVDGEAPVGIFDSPTVVKLEALVPKADEPAQQDDPVLIENSDPVIEAKTFEKTVVDTRPMPTATAAAATPAPVKLEAKPEIPAPAAAATNNPPPPPAKEPSAVFEDSFSNKPMPVAPRPTGVAKPTMNPVANGSFALEKLKKKNSTLVADKVKKVLSEMKAHYDKSMILTLDEQESQVTAFAWDENFHDMKDTSLRVPLKIPSIFNIVSSTQKSYHGYISLNEINEKFFDQWNQGRIPDHVTITPIIVQEKMVGMLMGFAEKSAYNKASLGLAEKLSGEFSKDLAA